MGREANPGFARQSITARRDDLVVVHASDLHFDGDPDRRAMLDEEIDRILAEDPDVVVISGDLTDHGSHGEFDEIAEVLTRLEPIPVIAVPGNRDIRQCDTDDEDAVAMQAALSSFREVGRESLSQGVANSPLRFAQWFGAPNMVYRDDRMCVVGLDSNSHIPKVVLETARQVLRDAPADALRILVTHHPLLPVPAKKLERGDMPRNAGDLLALALDEGVDVICTGHHHRSHVAEIRWEGAAVLLSMAPMLTHATPRKHRGFHVIERPAGTDAAAVRAVRTEIFHFAAASRA